MRGHSNPAAAGKRVSALLNQPNGQGVLVIDEATLIGRLFFKCSSNLIIGLADDNSFYSDLRPLF